VGNSQYGLPLLHLRELRKPLHRLASYRNPMLVKRTLPIT
jgi:hypothetical protein